MLEEALRDLPLGGLRYYDRLESTNTEAADWADAGAPDMALVAADEQTAGRGRAGRSWLTPPGAALAFSLVLKDFGFLIGDAVPSHLPEAPALLARLTALGAVAVSAALQTGYALPAQIKWPNDVLLLRRKVCGVLAEAHWRGDRLQAAILGIGVNVAPASAPDDASVLYPAAAVETVLGREIDRIELLRSILAAIIEWRGQITSPRFLETWDQMLAFKGEQVRIFSGVDLDATADEEGILLGLDERGCLRLLAESGKTSAICSGELRLRPVE